MSETGDPHLRDDILAAYLDRTLPPPARATADTHLVTCASCRDELVAMSALARSPGRARRFSRLAVPLAVAATLLLVIRGPWTAPRQSPADERQRLRETTGVAGVTARLAALAPPDSATVSASSLRFIWRSEPRDAGYHLVVTDDGGTARWTLDTSDTTASLPDSVRLEPGRTYYWYVDALGGDGRTRASTLRRFQVVP